MKNNAVSSMIQFQQKFEKFNDESILERLENLENNYNSLLIFINKFSEFFNGIKWNKIESDTINLKSENYTDTNLELIADEDGIYLIDVFARFQENSDNWRSNGINKNGEKFKWNVFRATQNDLTYSNYHYIVQVNKGDILSPHLFQNSGKALNVKSAMEYIFLKI